MQPMRRKRRGATLAGGALTLTLIWIARSDAGLNSPSAVCKEVTFEATFLREKNTVEVVGKVCLHNGRWRLVAVEE
jgi:hypothetical protein